MTGLFVEKYRKKNKNCPPYSRHSIHPGKVFFRNGESEPLVYATSPTEVASSLWSEDKRVPDILSDLNKVELKIKKIIFSE